MDAAAAAAPTPPHPTPRSDGREAEPREQGPRADGAQFAVWSMNLPVWHEGRDGQGALGAKEGNGRIKPTELPCCCSVSCPRSPPRPLAPLAGCAWLMLPKQAGNGVYQLKAIYLEIQLPDFPSFVYF